MASSLKAPSKNARVCVGGGDPPQLRATVASAVADNQPVHRMTKNRMKDELTFAGFTARLREFISTFKFEVSSSEFDQSLVTSTATRFQELAMALFRLQFQHNAAYRCLCEARGISPEAISTWQEIPAVPTSAFKELELTSLEPHERTTMFLSSGTTAQRRSRHFHNADSLAIYEMSLLPWFERHMLGDINELIEEQLLGPLDKLPFLALTPPLTAAPNSSLVHMFETVRPEFGSRDSLFTGRVDASENWIVDMDATLFAIRKSMCANRPLVLLGTAFNFVHLLDHFAANNMRYRLARGSRVLETGGYKGRSREVSKSELHALITKHLGVQSEYIVTEYGMSELSSQAYDRTPQTPNSKSPLNSAPGTRQAAIQNPESAIFHFPPWARAQIISPETNREIADGETGLIRIFDLANVRSVMAIQTEDLAVRRGNGFELIGRATQAEPRGCSLMSLNAEP